MRSLRRHLSLLVLVFTTGLACSSSREPPPAPGTSDVGGGGGGGGGGAVDDTTPPAPPGGPDTGDTPAPSDPGTTHPPLFVGRFDTTDPAGPKAAWPGARILARFEGTAVSVELSDFAEPWMDGTPSYWEVSIDHGPWTPIAMTPDNRPHVYELAKDLPAAAHEVELFKRSETQTGITQFFGFDFHGGKSLPPPERQKRKIEVMGDSQASGFGIEMLNAPDLNCPGANHSGTYQNFRKAWGSLLGTRFDAEVHGIVYSGKGLLKNVWPTDTDPLVDYYPRTNPNPAIAQSAQLFDLSSWVPDVIVLTQGSVDFGSGVSDGEFRAAYRRFVVDTLRARGPNTHIFMSVLGMGGRGTIDDVGRQIVAERAAVGDDKMRTSSSPSRTRTTR
ncbi:MAG: hypothetical protein KIS78_07415 [Labilithrix sp.]|nr:hypothetical protein [Labilithrix sp.]